jgi:hypothetical protein
MRTFSPSDVAFEGFRLIGRRPGAVAVWALLNLVLGAVLVGLIWAVLGPDLPTLFSQIAAARTAAGGGAMDPSWAAPFALKMRAIQWIVQPFVLLFGVVLTCAVYRAMVQPSANGFGYLRFGGDEIRLIALGIVYFIMAFVAVLVLVLLGGFLGALLYFLLAKGGQGGGWIALVAVAAGVALVCTSIWVAVRLSLAWPISFAEKRIAIFDSWRLTRGNFWSLLGTYLLSWIFALIFSMGAMLVLGVVVLIGAMSFGGVLHGEAPDWTKAGPAIAVIGGIGLVANSVLSAMTQVVITAPGMAIYGALSGAPTTVGAAFTEEPPPSGAIVL